MVGISYLFVMITQNAKFQDAMFLPFHPPTFISLFEPKSMYNRTLTGCRPHFYVRGQFFFEKRENEILALTVITNHTGITLTNQAIVVYRQTIVY